MVKIKGPFGNTGIKKSSPIWHDLYKAILSYDPYCKYVVSKLKENNVIEGDLVLRYARQEFRLGGGVRIGKRTEKGLECDISPSLYVDCIWDLSHDDGSTCRIYNEIKSGNIGLPKMLDKYNEYIIDNRAPHLDDIEVEESEKILLIWAWEEYHKKEPQEDYCEIPYKRVNLEVIEPILDDALRSIGLVKKQDSK